MDPCSYLKGLYPKFNECVELFLDKLAPHADGRTEVPMKKHICATTLDIISKARRWRMFPWDWGGEHARVILSNRVAGCLCFGL